MNKCVSCGKRTSDLKEYFWFSNTFQKNIVDFLCEECYEERVRVDGIKAARCTHCGDYWNVAYYDHVVKYLCGVCASKEMVIYGW